MTQADSATEKAQAEAELAKLNAEQKRRELAEWTSELARRRREAENESAIATANKSSDDARSSQWTNLVSGPAGVSPSGTTVSGEQPILGGALAMKGLRSAAEKVVAVVHGKAPAAKSILVTSETDLATSDAAYLAVRNSLDELHAAATQLLEQEWPPPMTELAAVGVVADLIPSVLGMLAAKRAVSTFATSVDDLSAAANVIGALIDAQRDYDVVHDDFRMRGPGAIDERLGELGTKRGSLVEAAQVAVPAGYEAEWIARKERIKTLIAAIDAFTISVQTVPTGSTRSTLTNAALYEGLHTGKIDHVLLVKGVAGSGAQIVTDRPLWFKDKFSVVATTNITYVLLNVATNQIAHSGTASATVSLHGTIGTKLGDEFG